VIGGLTGILCPSSYRFFASFLVANARANNFISSAPDSALKDDREAWPYDASYRRRGQGLSWQIPPKKLLLTGPGHKKHCKKWLTGQKRPGIRSNPGFNPVVAPHQNPAPELPAKRASPLIQVSGRALREIALD
jgi:hypothetical protein